MASVRKKSAWVSVLCGGLCGGLGGGVASLLLVVLLFGIGCQPSLPTPVAFEPNFVYAHKLMLQFEDLQTEDGTNLLSKPLRECFAVLEEEFGTPEAPKIPKSLTEDENLSSLLDSQRMQSAVWNGKPEAGLYRKNCATCHGESGSGRGFTAASQNPYPRDFRYGEFKFKSTPRGSKPTRADLRRVIAHGLPGSQMPPFDKLKDAEVESLVDYVIYLSLRGQLERDLMKYASTQLQSEEYDPAEELFPSEMVEEQLAKIGRTWAKAESEVETFATPTSFPVEGLSEQPAADALATSIARGKELFHGAVANCSKCHGENGNGKGKQDPDYDDFTKEWSTLVDLDPKNLEELHPVMAMGALLPQTTPPRTLSDGIFRGGKEPLDIFRRIRYGINKTPMPSAALADGKGGLGLTDDDIWHLVNYVRSLSANPPVGM